ncbi:MAG: glutaredoxin 3 [Pseudomonadota bacterium]|nr:glutaredoxin 3 [Pseudomonadota bacterium]
MEQVTVYSAPGCSSCDDTKKFLKERNIQFSDVNVLADEALKEEMTKMMGGELSLPQVVIGGRLVGGYDRLQELAANGKLDQLLASKGACCRGLPADQCSDTHRGMGKKKEEAHVH